MMKNRIREELKCFLCNSGIEKFNSKELEVISEVTQKYKEKCQSIQEEYLKNNDNLGFVTSRALYQLFKDYFDYIEAAIATEKQKRKN